MPRAILPTWTKRVGIAPAQQVRVLDPRARNAHPKHIERAGSVAGDEEMPGAVGSDPDTVESVDPELHHVLVVGAGDDPKELDLLLRRQRGERHAHEIGP